MHKQPLLGKKNKDKKNIQATRGVNAAQNVPGMMITTASGAGRVVKMLTIVSVAPFDKVRFMSREGKQREHLAGQLLFGAKVITE